MKAVLPVLVLLGLFGGFAPAGQESKAAEVRVGTYDNRAIAVAYAASRFNPVAEKKELLEQAKKTGDRSRVADLEAWGERYQRRLHRQAFARVPVDDLFEPVKERLAEVARQSGLALIAPSCDWTDAGVQVVDVTDSLVALYEPSAKTLATVAELRKQPPLDLEEVEEGHDH